MPEAEADQLALAQAIKLIKCGIRREEAVDIFQSQGLDFTTQLDELAKLLPKKLSTSDHHHLTLEEVYNVDFGGSIRYILSLLSVSPHLRFSHVVLSSTCSTAYLSELPEEWPAQLSPVDLERQVDEAYRVVNGLMLSSVVTDLNWPAPPQSSESGRRFESFGDYIDIFGNKFLSELLGAAASGPFVIQKDGIIAQAPVDLRGMGSDRTKEYIASRLGSSLSIDTAGMGIQMQTGLDNKFIMAICKLRQLSQYARENGHMHMYRSYGWPWNDQYHYEDLLRCPEVFDWLSVHTLGTCAVSRKGQLDKVEHPEVGMSEEDWSHIEALCMGLKAAYRLRSTHPVIESAPVIACDVASTLFLQCEDLKVKTETAGLVGKVARLALGIWEGIIFNGRSVIPSAIAMLPWGRLEGIKVVFPTQDLTDLECQLGEQLDRVGIISIPGGRQSPIKSRNVPNLDPVVDKHVVLHNYLHSREYPHHPWPFPSRYPDHCESHFDYRYPMEEWAEMQCDGLEYWSYQSDFGLNYQIAKLAIGVLSTPAITYEERVRCMGSESESRAMRERLTKTSLGGEDRFLMKVHEELHRNPNLGQPPSTLGKRRRVD